ncbi:hypothetical protein GCM10027088_53170 [Nocardia goodfellowii]
MEEEERDWDGEDDGDDDDIDFFAALPAAFALAAQLTQVRFAPEMLDRAMLVGPVAPRALASCRTSWPTALPETSGEMPGNSAMTMTAGPEPLRKMVRVLPS